MCFKCQAAAIRLLAVFFAVEPAFGFAYLEYDMGTGVAYLQPAPYPVPSPIVFPSANSRLRFGSSGEMLNIDNSRRLGVGISGQALYAADTEVNVYALGILVWHEVPVFKGKHIFFYGGVEMGPSRLYWRQGSQNLRTENWAAEISFTQKIEFRYFTPNFVHIMIRQNALVGFENGAAQRPVGALQFSIGVANEYW